MHAAANDGAGTVDKAPLSAPIGVRTEPTMNTLLDIDILQSAFSRLRPSATYSFWQVARLRQHCLTPSFAAEL
jgi:hypothetical protein